MLWITKRQTDIQDAFIVAILLRTALILVGVYFDGHSGIDSVNYTDIDYNVYSDAARLIWEGKSPYDRETYRYPPLMAVILIPNISWSLFGKILFSIADVGMVYESYRILLVSACPKAKLYWAVMAWAANPLAASICTRGSCDSVNNYLIMSSLHAILRGDFWLSGLLLGLAVHLRMYPVIFIPCMLLHALSRTSPLPAPTASVSMWSVKSHTRPVSADGTSTRPAAPSSHRDIWAHSHSLDRLNRILVYWRITPLKYAQIMGAISFLVGLLATVVVLTTLSFICCGERYIREAILYHIERSDPRHNFSVHFYWMYLASSVKQMPSLLATAFSPSTGVGSMLGAFMSNALTPAVLSLLRALTFLPQMVLLMLIALCLARKDLPACFLLTAHVFVAYNKVCTAQYFTWFACFLPVVAGRSQLPVSISGVLAVLWVSAVAIWLYNAHSLEFLGQNSFFAVWMSSIIFHVVNVLCIAFVIIEVN